MRNCIPPPARLLRQLILPGMLVLSSLSGSGQSLALHTREAPFTQETGRQSLKAVLSELERRHGVTFTYTSDVVNEQIVSDASWRRHSDAEVALKQVLKDINLTYKKIGSANYVIKAKARRKLRSSAGTPALPFIPTLTSRSGAAPAATAVLTVSGRVTSGENGQGLPGVNVLVKGTTTGTTTNAEGQYSLAVPDANANGALVFSYIGYLPEEVAINNRTTIDVSLAPDIKSLTEVVVVGYGTVQRRDVTGAVSSISEQEIKQVPVLSTDQALQGRAAGVQVTQTSGEPGSAISIRVRGGNSINAGNEPLFVVDGFPLSPGSSLNSINPNDIESIEVLKDASATAIYGSRGANGVVLVTTKRGKAGKPAVSYEAYYGRQQLRRKIPLLNAPQYAQLLNEANVNAGQPPAFTPDEIAAFGEGTDWQDELYQNAPIHNHQLSVSGGSENIRYAVSGNYFKQDGILINTGFDRYSFRANLDIDLSKRLKIGNSLTISRSNVRGVETENDGRGVVINALKFTPLSSVYNADGSFNQVDIPQVDIRGNPVARVLGTTDLSKRTRLLGNVFADYTIVEGLTLRVSLGTDLNLSKSNLYVPSTIFEGAPTNGAASVFSDDFSSWLNENTLSYRKTFNNIHALDAVVGVTLQEFNYENVTARTQNFTADVLTYNNLFTGADPQPPYSDSYRNALLSYLGRVNYILKDKYLFTLTGRADGSSRFGEGNKFAFFPSGSVAWRISEEPFMRGVGFLSDLKLRASAGITGSQEIGNYQSLAALGTYRYVLGSGGNYAPRVGFGPNRVANPDLRWESTRQFDVGLDVGFFNNRLTSTLDLYYKRTYDLLLNVPLPFTSGFGTSLQNIGKTENRGVELSITSQNLTGPFSWSTSLNLAANRNKVLDLGEIDYFYAGSSSGGQKYGASGIVQVGQPIGSFIGILADGIFQNQAEIDAHSVQLPNGNTKLIQPNARPGDRRFVDLNGDGNINADDRTIIGRAYPKFFGGMTNTFTYKGIELSIFLQGASGASVLNLVRPEIENLTGGSNQLTTVLNRWTPENPGNTIPRATARTTRPNLISSDMVEDGSYLRARNITLGYTFPAALLKSVRMQRLRLYVSAQNLFTITDYTGYDPEVNTFGQSNLSLGTDYGAYPSSKMYLVGLNVGF